MFSAMQNIVPSHLCDKNLFNFKDIQRGQNLDGVEGDIAFDKQDLPATPLFQDEDEQTDFSQNEQITFKVVD